MSVKRKLHLAESAFEFIKSLDFSKFETNFRAGLYLKVVYAFPTEYRNEIHEVIIDTPYKKVIKNYEFEKECKICLAVVPSIF